MNQGQRAMVGAQILSLLNKDSKDGSKKRAAETVGVSAGRISQALAVLEYAPELVDSVVVGGRPLNDAYNRAQG
jgi:molybdenum-dependent DNA-binding transcriptional regulator ModE